MANPVSASKAKSSHTTKSSFLKQSSRRQICFPVSAKKFSQTSSLSAKQNPRRLIQFLPAEFSQTNPFSASKILADKSAFRKQGSRRRVHFLQSKVSASKVLADKSSFRKQNSSREIHFRQEKFLHRSFTFRWQSSRRQIRFSQANFSQIIRLSAQAKFS